MNIGKNIQLLRRRSGYTQDQTLARLHLMGFETSKSSYAKIETNRMNIRISELIALKKIFHATYDEFFLNLEEQFEESLKEK